MADEPAQVAALVSPRPAGLTTQVSGLLRLLDPTSIAIVGLSADPAKHGARVLTALRSLGYRGEVYGVNPGRPDIEGVEVFAGVEELPTVPDLVVAAVPADSVRNLVGDCSGVGGIVVFSAGFAEGGREGLAMQQDLADAVREVGTRLLGPNSGGVIRPAVGLAASFLTCLERPPGQIKSGPVAVVTQSGGMGSYLHNLAAARGEGIAVSVSTGNEADIGLGEAVAAVSGLDEVEVVLAVVETIRDGPVFVDAVRSAHASSKQVVVCQIGAGLTGERLMASHTGALAVPRAIMSGLFETLGVTVAETPAEAYDVAMILARSTSAAGGRVGIVTHSGGAALLLADLVHRAGLTLAPPGPGLRETIGPYLDHGSPSNPADLGAIIGDPGRFASAVEEFASSADYDLILAVSTAHPPAHTLKRAESLVALGASAPVVHLWMAGDQATEGLALLREAGKAVTEEPRAAIRALVGLIKQLDSSLLPAGITGPPQDWGIPSHAGVVCATAGEAAAAAESLGYPVVVKLEANDVAHKTDLGGVVLDVRDVHGLERACRSIFEAALGAGLDAPSLRVQRFRPGLEVIVGAMRHELIGPLVSIGFGGVLTEVLDDVAFAPAPVTPATALEMVGRLRAHHLLDGYRGAPPADVTELARIVSQVSRGICGLSVEEFEINPLIWDGVEWLAVDVLSR